MSRKFFGTDGIRGVANRVLTPEVAFQIGQAAGRWLVSKGAKRQVAIGRDTRRSGPMLGAALAAGFNSAGVDVVALGVAPTPAVSYVVRHGAFSLGAVISASHNPAPDNGIKLLNADGGKLPDSWEAEIEALIGAPFEDRPEGDQIGLLTTQSSAMDDYGDWLVTLVPERLDGLKVVVDGAHGAAYQLGPEVLQRLGAEVIVVGDTPDGLNINAEGGATKPKFAQEIVTKTGSDAGISFDGDADRCVFSDDQGRLINGDRTIAIWAAHHKPNLANHVVVGTVMSNMGFEQYMEAQGIRLIRAKVGDKYVSEQIREHHAPIGGEQSGHIIFPNHGPTGDGLATMLEFLRVVVREKKKVSELFDQFENWPQVMVNLRVADKETWGDSSEVKAAIAHAETLVEGNGRVNVRASGTQPVVRVMVESSDQGIRDQAADAIVSALKAHAGAHIEGTVDLTHDLGD